MTRLKRSKGSELGREPVAYIDIAELIKDEKVEGLGKKAVIQAVMAEVEALDPEFAGRVKSKLGVLLDREWDGLELDMHLKQEWCAPTQNLPYFVTVGHSVENYFFRPKAIEAYLRQHYFNALDQSFFNALHERFHQIIAFATVYSLAIRYSSCITKSNGVISRDHVTWHDGKYLATPSLIDALVTRGINLPNTFDSFINQHIVIYLQKHQTPEPGRWLCHGHLGEDAIWACIANLSLQLYSNATLAKNIERGHKETRFNHAVDFLSRESLPSSGPLNTAIEWLVAA